MSGNLLCVLRSAATAVATAKGRERWCFSCRKTLAGIYYWMVEPPGSYYEPHWRYECDGCGGDFRLFPGTYWMDGAAGPDLLDGPTVVSS